MNEIELTTGAWYEEHKEIFRLPDTCTVDVLAPRDHDGLSDDDIARIVGPALSARLRSLQPDARVVCVVDDLGRPTPASRIIPAVLQRLEERGIAADNVRFLIATGSHRQLQRIEMEKKLGKSIVDRFEIVSHDAFNSPMVDLGKLPDGFPCVVNRLATDADLIIGIGCVIPHSCHGFGGGAKLFLPGIAGFASISHLHGLVAKRGRGNDTARNARVDRRTVSEAFAALLPPIFLVNVVVNTGREIAGVFVGDFREVYQQACALASRVYGTPIKKAAVLEYDLVIANAYPLDADPVQSDKGKWVSSVFRNALVIHVNACRDGIDYHGWKGWRRSSALCKAFLKVFRKIEHAQSLPEFLKCLVKRGPIGWCRNALFRWFALSLAVDYPTYQLHSRQTASHPHIPRAQVTPENGPWFFSQHYTAEQYRKKYTRGAVSNDWEAIRSAIAQHFPDSRVAVLPCAPIQLPELES